MHAVDWSELNHCKFELGRSKIACSSIATDASFDVAVIQFVFDIYSAALDGWVTLHKQCEPPSILATGEVNLDRLK